MNERLGCETTAMRRRPEAIVQTGLNADGEHAAHQGVGVPAWPPPRTGATSRASVGPAVFLEYGPTQVAFAASFTAPTLRNGYLHLDHAGFLAV